jgi:hypothetical protein
MKLLRRILCALALALLVPPLAAAHSAPSYVSTFRAVTPSVPHLLVSVVGKGNGIVVDNRTGKTVVVLGYQREPYLRFGPDGVYRNANSPATYLNLSLYASGAIPPTANADAKPLWRKVASGHVFRWHDHRIHWATPVAPLVVRKDPGKRHHVFDWLVPARAGGRAVEIRGSLDYVPGGGGLAELLLPLSLLPVVLLVGVGGIRHARTKR